VSGALLPPCTRCGGAVVCERVPMTGRVVESCTGCGARRPLVAVSVRVTAPPPARRCVECGADLAGLAYPGARLYCEGCAGGRRAERNAQRRAQRSALRARGRAGWGVGG
jgi:hypothetical protein